jgi:hypothetical protein
MVNTSKFPAEMIKAIGLDVYDQKECMEKFTEMSDQKGAKFEMFEIADSLHVS